MRDDKPNETIHRGIIKQLTYTYYVHFFILLNTKQFSLLLSINLLAIFLNSYQLKGGGAKEISQSLLDLWFN